MFEASDWDEEAFAQLRKLGGQAYLEKIVRIFLEHTPQGMSAVHAGQSANDLEAIRQAAHSLKSSAGVLGARRLRELCESIEGLARERKSDQLSPLLRELDDVYSKVVADLEGMNETARGATLA